MSIHEISPNLNDNLMIQFNEGKGYQGIRALKTLSWEIQEVTSNVAITLT